MKDQLSGDPPTIGSCRRHGMATFSVHCGAPCGHVSRITFDTLRLPDETVFLDIPKKRRLRCSECGRRATEISASWNEVVALGNGKRPMFGWVVVVEMAGGVEARSTPLEPRERAISLALDLADAGDKVLRVEGPSGDLTAEEIEAKRAARRGSGSMPPRPPDC